MGEFEFIAKYLTQLCGLEALDLKDDVAIWTPPLGVDAVISMDTLVEGVHFPDGKFDAQIAQKLIRVNISDLTAKGASPIGYFLSLTLPKQIGELQLSNFCKGLAQDQEQYGLKLWGGDTTRTQGGCVLGMTIIGTVPTGQTKLRNTATPGDIVCVSGTIGDAYLGLKTVLGEVKESKGASKYWQDIYHIPKPPFTMRKKIREFATAALDISDGLIADAGHLAKASKVGVQIDIEAIPLSSYTQKWMSHQPCPIRARMALASGGDDYQTLMTMTEDKYQAAVLHGMDVTKIGIIKGSSEVVCLDGQGRIIPIEKSGYTHF